eukprot:m.227165 g.227165  ORF g.227165 m.227165 type:complete len:282 (+) comp18813_c0_seq7:296-1141(+)
MGEAIGAIRSLTNKAFEICILLVTVYILVELNQVPAGCDHSHVCLAAYLADGGDAEPDYIVPSCAVLREQCARGYAYYLFQGNAKSTLSAAELAIYNGAYKVHADFCGCMVEKVDESVYCDFNEERNNFFWAGVLIIYLMEASGITAKHRFFRTVITALAVGYFFLAAMIFDRDIGCSSYEYNQLAQIVRDLSFACLAVMIGTVGLELLATFGVLSASCCKVLCGKKKVTPVEEMDEVEKGNPTPHSGRPGPIEKRPQNRTQSLRTDDGNDTTPFLDEDEV